MILLLATLSCSRAPLRQLVTIEFKTSCQATRSSVNPPEEAVEDVNLFIFGPEGVMEEHIWAKSSTGISVSLLEDVPYTYFACANAGYRLQDVGIEELEGMRYYLTYTDEYSKGIPMSCVARDVVAGEEGKVELELQRCMARLEIRMDRSALYSGVDIDVESIEVGACPRSVQLFGKSRVRSKDDIFAKGFNKDGRDVWALNTGSGAVSEPLYLYILENCQGDLLDDAHGPEDKVFESLDGRGELCSHVIIKASYYSPRYHTKPGEYLIYRFYLGESPGNFDVRRNVNYRITVRPEGSGLNENSWRVDRGAIEAN